MRFCFTSITSGYLPIALTRSQCIRAPASRIPFLASHVPPQPRHPLHLARPLPPQQRPIPQPDPEIHRDSVHSRHRREDRPHAARPQFIFDQRRRPHPRTSPRFCSRRAYELHDRAPSARCVEAVHHQTDGTVIALDDMHCAAISDRGIGRDRRCVVVDGAGDGREPTDEPCAIGVAEFAEYDHRGTTGRMEGRTSESVLVGASRRFTITSAGDAAARARLWRRPRSTRWPPLLFQRTPMCTEYRGT